MAPSIGDIKIVPQRYLAGESTSGQIFSTHKSDHNIQTVTFTEKMSTGHK
jgi:hypothetical protein